MPHIYPKTRGKKPKACDRCARLRRACTSTQPCVACAQHRSKCTYNRVHQVRGERGTEYRQHQADIPLSAFENQHFAAPTTSNEVTGTYALEPVAVHHQPTSLGSTIHDTHRHSSLEVGYLPDYDTGALYCLPKALSFPRPTDLDIDELKSFPFLRKMASTDGLGNVFECGTLSQRSVIAGNMRCANSFYLDDLESMPMATDWLDPTSGGIPLETGNLILEVPPELVSKSGAIVSRIVQATACDRYTCRRKFLRGDTWEKELACQVFFSPTHLKRYLSLYWSSWHPNWPVMHKPSFSTVTAAPVLVAAMAVIGACLSTVEDDCALAKLVFDAVEDTVFDDEAFAVDQLPISQEYPQTKDLRTRLDILLAAYCVCLYQTWEGDKRAKRRVIRQRYNQVIGVGHLFAIHMKKIGAEICSWLVILGLLRPH